MNKDFKTIPELFNFFYENYKDRNIFYQRENNDWKPVTAEDFYQSVVKLSNGLKSLGIKKGEKIGIISNPTPFWVMADFAIIISGGITVPIFRRISPENLKFELENSGINYIFIGDENEYEPVRLSGKKLKKIITIGFRKNDEMAVGFEQLLNTGEKMFNEKPKEKAGYQMIKEDDLVTIIYTSGSMGIPKGVMLTNKNIISQVHSATLIFEINSNDIALTSLPLSHIFERMVMYFYISRGIKIYFTDDINNIGQYILEVRPSIMTTVPRLLEKVQEKMKSRIEESHGINKIIGTAAVKRAEIKSVDDHGKGLLDHIYNKLVYSKFRKALGGNFKYIISGSAPLQDYLSSFFINIGLPLYEGYGLTEASPVIAANYTGNRKVGTVGKIYPGINVKIDNNGEILAKGPNIMKGYYKNPEETAKVLDKDGYLHTGDLGILDKDGYLKINGRRKELFKKSTGEYVPPVPIENALKRLDIIDMAVVIAEGKKYVSCLLFPNFEKVNKYKEKEGNSQLTLDQFLDSDFIQNRIKDHITDVNKHFHHTEEIQKYKIIKTPISIDTGELTPTMKIRRHIIDEKFKKEIDEMYKN